METVAIIGSGTMGSDIAQVTALGGYRVILYDVADDILEKSLDHIRASIDKGVSLGKVDPTAASRAKDAFRLTTVVQELAQADLVIEAVPEKLALKREVFARIDAHTRPGTILASNTSSLSINALAGAVTHPERFVGLHFFNPAHIMKLVEVIRADDTSDQTITAVDEFVRRLGKTAVHCNDTPAFIVNRVARPFYGEAYRLLGEGVASSRDIDRLLRSAGFPMGPFELVDLIGVDVNYDVSCSVYDAFFQDPKYRPHPIQRQMVEAGRLGRKSGRGFYEYSEERDA